MSVEMLGSLLLDRLMGKSVIIRTVTYHHTGRLVAADAHWLVLEDAAWVAESGCWSAALTTGTLSKVEPFPDGPVFVGAGAVADMALWPHPLPRKSI